MEALEEGRLESQRVVSDKNLYKHILSECGYRIAELKSKGGFRVYSTIDKFTLSPYRRISFEQIEGPLLSNRGEIKLTEIEDGTDLELHG